MVSKVFVFVCAMALFVAAASACKCTKIMKKVCGADGNTYNNSCLAKCAGTTASYNGPCRPRSKRNVACTQDYRPVCGTDGVTYGNSCMAEAAGVEATAGAC